MTSTGYAIVLCVAIAGAANAASIAYDCTNIDDPKDALALTVESSGAWRIKTSQGYYQGNVSTGRPRGIYVFFESPDSDASRGDGADDILIQNSLLNDSATWQSATVIGNVAIKWTDEDNRRHTDLFSCPAR